MAGCSWAGTGGRPAWRSPVRDRHRAEAFEGADVGVGDQHRHRAPPVGDLDRLAMLDHPQQLAGTLADLADTDLFHVLRVHKIIPAVAVFAFP